MDEKYQNSTSNEGTKCRPDNKDKNEKSSFDEIKCIIFLVKMYDLILKIIKKFLAFHWPLHETDFFKTLKFSQNYVKE